MIYKKLKSSSIIYENKLNLKLEQFNKEKKFSFLESDIIDKKENNHYKENINSNLINYDTINYSSKICGEIKPFAINPKIENYRKRNLSIDKNYKKLLRFKKLFEKNKEKENKLKMYIQKNNELLLSEEEFEQTYQKIKKLVIENKTPVESPIAITLGGQPGAGKSNIYDIARKRFSNNIVEIDCDAFRIFHPYYRQIKNIFGKEDAFKTNPFVFKIVDLLIEELSNEKYNLIIESSLNSPNSALENGKTLPPKGYQVELQIMATPKDISWQGTIDRYNKDSNKDGNSRAVSKEFHDKVVENICQSLYIVKNSGLMSNILIFDRNKKCLYDMKKDKNTDPCLLLFAIINGYLSKNNELALIMAILRKSSERMF
jgi:UDP-N-acetylglucosamine kinase